MQEQHARKPRPVRYGRVFTEVDPLLHRLLKLYCVQTNHSLQFVSSEALIAYLGVHGDDEIKKRLREVKREKPGPGRGGVAAAQRPRRSAGSASS